VIESLHQEEGWKIDLYADICQHIKEVQKFLYDEGHKDF
jgi:hypothetical protein